MDGALKYTQLGSRPLPHPQRLAPNVNGPTTCGNMAYFIISLQCQNESVPEHEVHVVLFWYASAQMIDLR
jgi:hypothetical protein